MAADKIRLSKDVTSDLKRDFYIFSNSFWPPEYKRSEDFFANTWYFDEKDLLSCYTGKFYEVSIWYDHLKEKFFKPRNIDLPEEPEIMCDLDDGFWELVEEREEEFRKWHAQMEKYGGERDRTFADKYGCQDDFYRMLGYEPKNGNHFVCNLPRGYVRKYDFGFIKKYFSSTPSII